LISSRLCDCDLHQPRAGMIEHCQHGALFGEIFWGIVRIMERDGAAVADDIGDLDRLYPGRSGPQAPA